MSGCCWPSGTVNTLIWVTIEASARALFALLLKCEPLSLNHVEEDPGHAPSLSGTRCCLSRVRPSGDTEPHREGAGLPMPLRSFSNSSMFRNIDDVAQERRSRLWNQRRSSGPRNRHVGDD